MKLAILSDTHGLLRPEVLEYLKTADAIFHGGDINKQSIVDELRQYAPLYIVRGNNDKDWAEAIPHDLTVTLGGVTFYMVHNKKEAHQEISADEIERGQQKILLLCEQPRTRKDLMYMLDVASKKTFFRLYLKPLLESGVLQMTIPDQRSVSTQRYVRV